MLLSSLVLFSMVPAARAEPPRGPEPQRVDGGPSGRLEVSFIRDGVLMQVRLDGNRLSARDAAGTPLAERTLTDAQRRGLLTLARAALADEEPRRACDLDEATSEPTTHELTLVVTLAGRSNWSAVCPSPGAWYMHPRRWWALRDRVRALLAGTKG